MFLRTGYHRLHRQYQKRPSPMFGSVESAQYGCVFFFLLSHCDYDSLVRLDVFHLAPLPLFDPMLLSHLESLEIDVGALLARRFVWVAHRSVHIYNVREICAFAALHYPLNRGVLVAAASFFCCSINCCPSCSSWSCNSRSCSRCCCRSFI